MQKDNKRLGIIYMCIASLSFALMSLFIKLSGDLPTVQKVFFRNFLASIVFIILMIKEKTSLKLTKEEKKAMIIAFDKRVKEILKIEGIEEYDSKVLAQLIVKHFPDFRRILNILQNITQTGKLDASAMSSVSVNVVDEVYQLLKKQDFVGMRHWVAENPDNDLPTLVRMSL